MKSAIIEAAEFIEVIVRQSRSVPIECSMTKMGECR